VSHAASNAALPGNALATGLGWPQLLAIVVFAAITPCVMLAAPVIAAQYGMQLGLAPAQIGDLFSAEMATMSLATIPAWWWQSRLNWRVMARLAAALFIVTNVASIWADSFGALLALRSLNGLGGGTLMVLCMSSAVASTDRDRTYGLWVSGQLALAAIALWALPGLFASFGLKALYGGLAALVLLTFPLTSAFPERAPSVTPLLQADVQGSRPWLRILLGLAAVLLFYIGLIAVWAFVGMIAESARIDGQTVGQILAVATVMGVVGSFSAAAIGKRGSRALWLLLGYGLMTVSVLLWFGTPGVVRFAIAAIIFKYVWTFVLPFILACIAEMDRNGQLINSTNLVIGGGLAIGPAIAGRMLQADTSLGWAGMSGLVLFSAVCLVVSWALLMGSRRGAVAASAFAGQGG